MIDLQLLSDARVEGAMDSLDWQWQRTDSGLLVAWWDVGPLFVLIDDAAEVLSVTALVDLDIPEDKAAAVDDFIDFWHRERWWPTCRRTGGGSDDNSQVLTEVAGFYPGGVADEQIAVLLRQAVSATTQFANALMHGVGLEAN